MNIVKKIAHRYGKNMSDAHYLALRSALDDMRDFMRDISAEWVRKESASTMADENELDYLKYVLEKSNMEK